MGDPRIPKEDNDSWVALHDYLHSMRECLERGCRRDLRIMICILRLLIADRKHKPGNGLLRRLVDESGYTCPVVWGEHTAESLNKFVNLPLLQQIHQGSSEFITIEEFIKDEAEKSGLAHDDPKYQNAISYMLRTQKREGWNPYRGDLMSLGLVILTWGEKFLDAYRPADTDFRE